MVQKGYKKLEKSMEKVTFCVFFIGVFLQIALLIVGFMLNSIIKGKYVDGKMEVKIWKRR